MIQWCEFNGKFPRQEKLENQVLWFNSKIRIGAKPIWYSEWYEKGIYRIGSLKKGKEFLTHSEFQEKYHITTPFTKFYGVISAVKKVEISKNECDNESQNNFNFYKSMAKPAKLIYSKIKSDETALQNTYNKFLKSWGIEQKECNYERFINTVTKINKITISSKLRSFQYRLISTAILTNIRLYHMGIKDSKICDYCECLETLTHLFWECPHTKKLWNYVKELIAMQITKEDMIVNDIQNRHTSAINAIILFTKYYIFKAKCNDERISVISLRNYIINGIEIEEGIAKNKNKLDQHKIKWQDIQLAI